VKVVNGSEDLMLITVHGILIRMDVNDISVTGRSTQGVKLIRLGENETVATVAKVEKDPDAETVEVVEVIEGEESSEITETVDEESEE